MSLIENITNFFSKPKSETQNEVLEGTCPNCWGKQEYDGKIRELYKDHQIDVNNKQANHSFIKDFVVTYIEGITLKKGNSGLECPTCVSK